MSPDNFTFWTLGQMLLHFPGVSQKWLSYNRINWISPLASVGQFNFAHWFRPLTLLKQSVFWLQGIIFKKNKIEIHISWDVLWMGL